MQGIQKDNTLHEIEPVFRSDMTVKLVDHMGSEDSIVSAARVSNDSDAGAHSEAANKGLLRALIREGHGSPLEHVELEWYLEVPIFASRQIVKYRQTSINERSGRYSNAVPEFYIPDYKTRPMAQVGKTMDYEFTHLAGYVQKLVAETMLDQTVSWWQGYATMREIGVSKEVARMTAPTNMYSALYVKMNLRTAIHFITQRIHMPDADRPSHGQYEIEMVAQGMLDIIEPMFPTVFEAVKASKWKKI